MRPSFARLLVVIVVSGACSLVYQVVWIRLLRLIFGASTYAGAAVVAIFMGGLGVGGWWFGRRAGRLPRPLRTYGLLELGIALSAAISPLWVAAARSLYLSTGGVFSLGLGFGSGLRLLLAAVVLGLPTVLMGGTLPMVVQALERRSDLGRRRTAWLYGLNTLGAAGGALAANFWLLEAVGVSASLYLAVAANLVLAAVVLVMARDSGGDLAGASPARAEAPRGPDAAAGGAEPGDVEGRRGWVLAAAGLFGFTFFGMELVWYRMLAPILGGSTYTFGLVLALALVGIALGGLVYALGAPGKRPRFSWLAMTCGLEALFMALPLLAGDRLALFAGEIRSLTAYGFPGLVTGWTLVGLAVVLPVAIVAGFQFPLLVGLLGSGRRQAGRDIGMAYACNTAGAIVGSLAIGFVLLPAMTAPLLWRATVILLVLAGAVLVAVERRWQARSWLTAAVLAAAAAAAILPAGPTAFWRHVPIGAGRADLQLEDANDWRRFRREVRWASFREAEGIESSLALQTVEDLGLLVNGKSDGSARVDAPTTVMSGLIGAALHGSPRSALVIGLGPGTTAGLFTSLPSIERVDIVELEPAVVRFAREFEAVNFGVLDSPKTRMHLGDGREFVLASRGSWDLIFSEPSNPYRSGVANLFSRELYQAAAARLGEGGLFLQWLQGYEVDTRLIQTVYATLTGAFPHVETWQVGVADLLLVASAEPVDHDAERLAALLGEPAYARAMRRVWAVEGVAGFYSGYVGGPDLASSLARSARPSTDDRPRIEFGFARNVGRRQLEPVRELLELSAQLGTDRPGQVAARILEQAAGLRRLRVIQGSAVGLRRPPADLREVARRLYADRQLASAAAVWSRQPEAPATPWDRQLLAESLAELADPRAGALIDGVRAQDPVAAEVIEARRLWRLQQPERALEALLRSIAGVQREAWLDRTLMLGLLELCEEIGRSDPARGSALLDALARPFAARLQEQRRQLLRVQLLSRQPDFERRCVEVLSELEPHAFWLRPLLALRLSCYRANHHPLEGRAAAELELLLDGLPATFHPLAED